MNPFNLWCSVHVQGTHLLHFAQNFFTTSFYTPTCRILCGYFVFLFKSLTHWFLLSPQSFSPVYPCERPLLSFFPGLRILSPFSISVLTVRSVPLTSFNIKALPQLHSLLDCIGSLAEDVVFEELLVSVPDHACPTGPPTSGLRSRYVSTSNRCSTIRDVLECPMSAGAALWWTSWKRGQDTPTCQEEIDGFVPYARQKAPWCGTGSAQPAVWIHLRSVWCCTEAGFPAPDGTWDLPTIYIPLFIYTLLKWQCYYTICCCVFLTEIQKGPMLSPCRTQVTVGHLHIKIHE